MILRYFPFLCLALSLQTYADESIYGYYSNVDAKSGESSGFEILLLNDGRGGKCNQSVLFQIF